MHYYELIFSLLSPPTPSPPAPFSFFLSLFPYSRTPYRYGSGSTRRHPRKSEAQSTQSMVVAAREVAPRRALHKPPAAPARAPSAVDAQRARGPWLPALEHPVGFHLFFFPLR